MRHNIVQRLFLVWMYLISYNRNQVSRKSRFLYDVRRLMRVPQILDEIVQFRIAKRERQWHQQPTLEKLVLGSIPINLTLNKGLRKDRVVLFVSNRQFDIWLLTQPIFKHIFYISSNYITGMFPSQSIYQKCSYSCRPKLLICRLIPGF